MGSSLESTFPHIYLIGCLGAFFQYSCGFILPFFPWDGQALLHTKGNGWSGAKFHSLCLLLKCLGPDVHWTGKEEANSEMGWSAGS